MMNVVVRIIRLVKEMWSADSGTRDRAVFIPLYRWPMERLTSNQASMLTAALGRCSLVISGLTQLMGGSVEGEDSGEIYGWMCPPFMLDGKHQFRIGARHVLEGAAHLHDALVRLGQMARGEVSLSDQQYIDEGTKVPPKYRALAAIVGTVLADNENLLSTSLAIADISLCGFWLSPPPAFFVGNPIEDHHPGLRLARIMEILPRVGALAFKPLGGDWDNAYSEFSVRVCKETGWPTPLSIAERAVRILPHLPQRYLEEEYHGRVMKLRLKHPSVLLIPGVFMDELLNVIMPPMVNSIINRSRLSGGAVERYLTVSIASSISGDLISRSYIRCPGFVQTNCPDAGGCVRKFPSPSAMPSGCLVARVFEEQFGPPIAAIRSVDHSNDA